MSARLVGVNSDRDQMNELFRAGARYEDGKLVIPAYIYNKICSPKMSAICKKWGFEWSPLEREWSKAIPAEKADAGIAWANKMMTEAWGFDFGKEAADQVHHKNMMEKDWYRKEWEAAHPATQTYRIQWYSQRRAQRDADCCGEL